MNQTQPFSYIKIFAIGSGFLALTLIWTFYNAYMPLILGDFIESRAIRGAIMGLDNLLAVFLIPLIGVWSDGLNTRLGNRLPFLVVGMPFAAIFFILIPFGAAIHFWLLILIDILFLFAMTFYRGPVIALMPDHTPPEKRSTANGIINFMGGLGALIALFGLSFAFGIHRSYPFIAAGILLFATFIILFFTIDRHPPYSETVTKNSSEDNESFIKKFSLLKKPEFRGPLFILIAIFLYFIGFTGVESQFTVYAVEHLGMKESAAGFTLGFFSLSFLIFAVPAGLMGSKWGKVPLMIVGLILQPLIFIIIPLLPLLEPIFPQLSQVYLLQGMLFIGGAAWALINVQAYPLVADLGGKQNIGFFTGMYYFFSMAAAIVAPALTGLLMDLFSPPALFYGSAGSFLFAYYFLTKGYRLVEID